MHLAKPNVFPWSSEGPTPKGYWNIVANHRKYFDWLATQLNIQTHEDWYSLTSTLLLKYGGSSMRTLYEGSYIRALKNSYPGNSLQMSLNSII